MYDVIDKSSILKATSRTKSGAGPSGIDADGENLSLQKYMMVVENLRAAITEISLTVKSNCVLDKKLDVRWQFILCRKFLTR